MIYILIALLWSVCQEVHWAVPMPGWANLVSALSSEGDTFKKYLHFPWEGV